MDQDKQDNSRCTQQPGRYRECKNRVKIGLFQANAKPTRKASPPRPSSPDRISRYISSKPLRTVRAARTRVSSSTR